MYLHSLVFKRWWNNLPYFCMKIMHFIFVGLLYIYSLTCILYYVGTDLFMWNLTRRYFFSKEEAFYATTINMPTMQTLIRLQGGSSKYLCPRFKGKGRMVKNGLLYLQQVQGGDCILPSFIYLAFFCFSLSLEDYSWILYQSAVTAHSLIYSLIQSINQEIFLKRILA